MVEIYFGIYWLGINSCQTKLYELKSVMDIIITIIMLKSSFLVILSDFMIILNKQNMTAGNGWCAGLPQMASKKSKKKKKEKLPAFT